MRLAPRSIWLLSILSLVAVACGDEADDASGDAGSPGTTGGTGTAGSSARAGSTSSPAGGTSAAGSSSSGRGGTNSASGGTSASGRGGTGASAANGGSTAEAGAGQGGGANSPSGGAPNGGAAANAGAQANGGVGGSVNATGGASGSATGGTAGEGDAGSGTSGTSGASGTNGASGSGGQANLPPGVSALFPGPNATNVCRDPQLRITFPSPPSLGNSGQIRVANASGGNVASVNMATNTITDSLGGQTFSLLRPAYVDGNTAVIYLPSRALAYGQTYSVTVDSGAIVPGNGAFSVTGANTWRFSTAAAAPSNLAALDVALDGSGDFCSVQGALDALPANNSAAARITIAAGTYHEVVYMSGKSNVTLHGADRKATVIAGTNNNNMNGGTKIRALVGIDAASNFVVENLTIHNLTPQGGSQAEALRMQNCTHCVVRDADILSLQDTLLWSGTVYAKNCYIEGNVDFVWGTGTAYFDTCEIKTVGRQGVVVQARNGGSGYGYVFVDSRITADAGITNSTLARIDVAEYPGSHVAYVNCTLGSHITGAGWTITGGTPGSQLRFWEYQSRDLAGNLVNTSQRLAGSKQISASEAASMRDKATVLGGWNPPD